jgi:hypothetical protein
MKLFFTLITLLSINAFASFDCQSTDADKQAYRLLIVERIGAPSTLTVQYKGQNVYHKGVVSTTEPNDSMSYTSLSFTNKNKAPAGLFVNLYRSGSQILGNFNEGSYLPVVPYLQLRCKLF